MWRFSTVLGCCLVVLHAQHDTDFRDLLSTPGDQASCGGCYGFAEASVIEWFAANVTKNPIALSTQFYVDCMEDDYGNDVNGCAGGIITDGLKYLITYQYHPYAVDYPYTATWNPQTCKDNGVKERKRRNALADVWVYNYIPLSKNAQAIREAVQKGPVISGMFIGSGMLGWGRGAVHTDTECSLDATPHAVSFVGWQENNGNPYFIMRNSYGTLWGDSGYAKYADNQENTYCNFHLNAYTLSVGKRHELEYMIGSGIRNFGEAREWCQDQDNIAPSNRKGWDLAIIPTHMHNLEVFDLLAEAFGTDAKKNDDFNYAWIGMFKQEWVDGTETNYVNWDDYKFKYPHTAMLRFLSGKSSRRGRWTTRGPGWKVNHRFVCSRYRAGRYVICL
ncbi:hypothetical protein ACHWQZ_G018895 [Mnemiopsis leidyi]